MCDGWQYQIGLHWTKRGQNWAQTVIKEIRLLNRRILRLQSSGVLWSTGTDVSAESQAPIFKEQKRNKSNKPDKVQLFQHMKWKYYSGNGYWKELVHKQNVNSFDSHPPPSSTLLSPLCALLLPSKRWQRFPTKISVYVPDKTVSRPNS
jgi:hypothetical protein